MNGKIVKERKFRKVRGTIGYTYCDKCGREIEDDEWHYARRKYEILREKVAMFGCPLTRTIEEAHLCEDCVQPDKIVKRSSERR